MFIYYFLFGNVPADPRDTHSDTGGPARLPALQVVGQWGHIYWNSVGWGNKYLALARPEQSRQDKSLLYCQDQPNEPTKEGPFSNVLCESPFTSVTTVSKGHSPLLSLWLIHSSKPERFFWENEVLYLTPLPQSTKPSRRPPWEAWRKGTWLASGTEPVFFCQEEMDWTILDWRKFMSYNTNKIGTFQTRPDGMGIFFIFLHRHF